MKTLPLAWASLRLHGRRYAAAAAAIVIGVGFCAATLAITSATKRGIGNALVVQYSKADVVVQPGGHGLPDSKLAEVESLPSVASATLWGSGGASIVWKNGTEGDYVGVAEVADAPELRWQTLQSGSFPTGTGEVAVDAVLASDEGVALGDTVRFQGRGQVLPVVVVGLTDPIKGGNYPQVFVADGLSGRWADIGGTNELLVSAAGGTSPDQLADQVRRMGIGGQIQTADQIRTSATSTATGDVDIIGLMFQAFVAIALVVMGLVIANTFAIMLAQRSRDLALMRCVGAERRQVFAMVVVEALALGIIASGIGTAVGLALAAGLVSLINMTALPVPMSLASPALVEILLPAAVGVAVTVIASLAPARRATRVSPVSAMRPAEPVTPVSTAGLVRIALGLAVLVTGSVVILAATRRASLLLGVAGGALAFLGILALTPVIVPAMMRLAAVLHRRLPRRLRGGVAVDLSIANSLRNPRRTAATVSALLIGVTLISMLAVGASSMSASAATAIDHNNPIDVTISGGGALPDGLAERVEAVPSVRDVVTISATTVRSRGADVSVATVEGGDASLVVRDRELSKALDAGLVVVPRDYGWLVGGKRKPMLRLQGARGPIEVQVAKRTGSVLGAVLVSKQTLTDLGGKTSPVALWVAVEDHVDPQSLVNDLDDAVDVPGPDPLVTSDYVTRSILDRALDIMLIVATALLGMAVLIAVVGVGNTLSLSVVERSREHAILRALGLTKGQQRLMLASEAALMAIAATLLGVALGTVFGWAGTVTAIGRVTEQDAVLDIPWLRLVGIVCVAVVAGLAASVIPARRATRISPAAALAEG